MRNTILEKYDKISAYILEYIEHHSIRTPEEMEKLSKTNTRKD
jgi:hypothetical protein